MTTDNWIRTDRRTFRPRLLAVGMSVALIAACTGSDGADDGATTTSPTTAPTTASTTGSTTDSAGTVTDTTDVVPDATGAPDDVLCPVSALPDDGRPVEIELWHAMSATTGVVLEELLADYNATQARVHVTATFQGGYSEAFSKYVNTLRSGGDLPTIVQLSEISMQQMVDSESIVPVEHCVAASDYDLSDFPELLLEQYRIEDQLVTMPFQLANPVLFYDGNDFVAAGLDPDDPPTNLSELVSVSQTLVDAGVATSGIALEVDAWSFEQWLFTAGVPLVDNDNGRTDRAQHALLESETVGDLLATLADMHDSGLLLITGRGGEQSGLARFIAVAQGTSTMTIASSASLGEIYNQIALVPDVDMRVGPFPGSSGGKTSVGGGSLYLTNEATDTERAAAWDLMTWLNEPAQQVRWSVGTGYVPTRISAADDPTLQEVWLERPGFRVAYDQLAAPGEIPGGGGPVIGDYLGVRDAIEDGLEALYAGSDPAQVQAQMQAAADEAISDYNRRIGE